MISELEEYIQNLAPSSQNNSRQIARRKFEWALTKHPITAQRIFESMGIWIEPDYNPNDDR